MSMINNKGIPMEIAKILRIIGSKKCLERAEILEDESFSMSSLNLRDLGLNSSNIKFIAGCLKQEKERNTDFLKSVSFSYNYHLGDLGVIALIRNLPTSICEIGLVDCGISDIGGIEILSWMRDSPMLQMICMEQNNFSAELRLKFKKFSASNPHVLVVY